MRYRGRKWSDIYIFLKVENRHFKVEVYAGSSSSVFFLITCHCCVSQHSHLDFFWTSLDVVYNYLEF